MIQNKPLLKKLSTLVSFEHLTIKKKLGPMPGGKGILSLAQSGDGTKYYAVQTDKSQIEFYNRMVSPVMIKPVADIGN